MFSIRSTQSNKRERGTYMLFFAAGILPLLVFMMALSLDVTNYMRSDQRLQEAADDAAMLAWRYLPYQKQAVEAVSRFIAQRGLSDTIAQIRLAPARPKSSDFNDEFEVILERKLPLTFMSYFAQDASLQLRSIARSRSTPADVFIAVDRSSYVAPGKLSDSWPNPVSSSYFTLSAPFTQFVDPESADKDLVTVAPAQLMTQLCFNPYFAQLKTTAITLYEYFSAAGRNGVGVGVFPGINLDYLRSIRGVLRPGQNVNDANPNSGEASPLQSEASRNQQDYHYYNGIRLGASSWCAAAAAQDSAVTAVEPYGDSKTATIEKIWRTSTPKAKNEITKIDGDDVVFNPDYQGALTVREALWSAVAKPSTPNSRGVVDAVIANLAVSPDSESVSGLAIRGGLTGTSTRTGIILSGDVPYFNGSRFNSGDTESDEVAKQLSESIDVVRQLLIKNESLRFKLIFVIVDDPSRPPLPTLGEIQERSNRLDDFFENEMKSYNLDGRMDLQVLYSNDFNHLSEHLLAAVVLDNKRKVLSY